MAATQWPKPSSKRTVATAQPIPSAISRPRFSSGSIQGTMSQIAAPNRTTTASVPSWCAVRSPTNGSSRARHITWKTLRGLHVFHSPTTSLTTSSNLVSTKAGQVHSSNNSLTFRQLRQWYPQRDKPTTAARRHVKGTVGSTGQPSPLQGRSPSFSEASACFS